MASYRFLAADLVTGVIRDEVPFRTVSFGRAINGAAPFAATIAARHPKATRQNLDPARTVIYVERDGRIVGDGIVWTPHMQSAGSGDRTLELHGASLWSYFRHGDVGRNIRHHLVFDQVDQLGIFRGLIDYAQDQPGGDIGLTVTDQLSGRIRRREWEAWERKNIRAACEELAAVDDGFEFETISRWASDGETVERVVQLGYPQRGRRTTYTFAHDVNLQDWSAVTSGDRLANIVDVYGQGLEDDRPIGTAADLSNVGPGGYPLLEKVVPRTSVGDIETLNGHARAELRRYRHVPQRLTLVVKPDGRPRFSSYLPGDEVQVSIADGWLTVNGWYRIASFQVSVNHDRQETVTLEVARTEPL